jgi:hypothetical protein
MRRVRAALFGGLVVAASLIGFSAPAQAATYSCSPWEALDAHVPNVWVMTCIERNVGADGRVFKRGKVWVQNNSTASVYVSKLDIDTTLPGSASSCTGGWLGTGGRQFYCPSLVREDTTRGDDIEWARATIHFFDPVWQNYTWHLFNSLP